MLDTKPSPGLMLFYYQSVYIYKLQRNSNPKYISFRSKNCMKNIICKMSAILFRLPCFEYPNTLKETYTSRTGPPHCSTIQPFCHWYDNWYVNTPSLVDLVAWLLSQLSTEHLDLEAFSLKPELLNKNGYEMLSLSHPTGTLIYTLHSNGYHMSNFYHKQFIVYTCDLTALHRHHLQTPLVCLVLTHWGRNKMAAFSQTTLSNAFSWMKILEFRLRFHWSLFLWVLLTIIQHWFW